MIEFLMFYKFRFVLSFKGLLAIWFDTVFFNFFFFFLVYFLFIRVFFENYTPLYCLWFSFLSCFLIEGLLIIHSNCCLPALMFAFSSVSLIQYGNCISISLWVTPYVMSLIGRMLKEKLKHCLAHKHMLQMLYTHIR